MFKPHPSAGYVRRLSVLTNTVTELKTTGNRTAALKIARDGDVPICDHAQLSFKLAHDACKRHWSRPAMSFTQYTTRSGCAWLSATRSRDALYGVDDGDSGSESLIGKPCRLGRPAVLF